MNLGAFSISLAVKDLAVSQAFYEKLGFERVHGGESWAVLRSRETVIGLFQGMFERNTLTFNPGWNQQAGEVDPFTDVREIEASLRERGIEPQMSNVGDSEAGPAHLFFLDPDGNPILIDQHR